jgi:hypothetical protein
VISLWQSTYNRVRPRSTAFVAGLSATCACQRPGSGLPATDGRHQAVASTRLGPKDRSGQHVGA